MVFAMAVFGLGQSFAQLKDGDYGIFNHVSAGVSVGTDGIGLQVAAPLTYHFAVRAGYQFFPKLKYNDTFDVGSDPAFTTSDVDIEGKLNISSGNILFDYYPFSKSSFHVTAGAYFGTSKILSVTNKNQFISPDNWGTAGIQLAQGDSPMDKYTIVSDEKGNIQADLKVNGFRPYLGIGFGRAVPRKRIGCQFDLGIQFWGTPEVLTTLMYFDSAEGDFVRANEKVNKNRITRQDKDYQDVKDAIKTIEKVGVYPVLTFRLNGRIF